VSAQVLTYPQYSESDNFCPTGYPAPSGNPEHWCQVIDSSDFFEDASNLSDQGSTSANPAFGGTSTGFPTKLSTETVGDFKNAYGS
jgi:hypothetical protein